MRTRAYTGLAESASDAGTGCAGWRIGAGPAWRDPSPCSM